MLDFKMRSSFYFLRLTVVLFAISVAKYSSVNASKNQTPIPAKRSDKNPVNNCNCHCNLHQDSSVTEDIKEVKATLEQLIALVNKTSPANLQPTTTPGKLILSGFDSQENLQQALLIFATTFYCLQLLPSPRARNSTKETSKSA